MTRVGRFLRRPVQSQILVVKTVMLLGTIRIGMWILPFRTVRTAVNRLSLRRESGRRRPPTRDQVIWAVNIARRLIPRATCLPQALTAKALLGRHGHVATLRIGVAKTDEGRLEAHAWVESEGQVLVGHLPDLPRYQPLPPLPGEL